MLPNNGKERGYYPRQNSLALFVDVDNIPGGKSAPTIGALVNALKPWGELVVRRAYSSSFSAKRAIYEQLLEHHFALSEVPRSAPKKNSADIHMTMEIMETIHTRPGITGIAIASGDGDFASLMARIRQHRLAVIGIGSKKSTSQHLVRQCDAFLFCEDIAAPDKPRVFVPHAQPVKVGCEAVRRVLRRHSVYPPEPEMRHEILVQLVRIGQEVQLPIFFKEFQQLLMQRGDEIGASRTMVRHLIHALDKTGGLFMQDDVPLTQRQVANIPDITTMEDAIRRYQLQCLVSEPDLIADPVAISQVIWGNSKYTGEVTALLKKMA